jgi:hypothetical protein
MKPEIFKATLTLFLCSDEVFNAGFIAPLIASSPHRFIASMLLVPSSPCWHEKYYLALHPHS